MVMARQSAVMVLWMQTEFSKEVQRHWADGRQLFCALIRSNSTNANGSNEQRPVEQPVRSEILVPVSRSLVEDHDWEQDQDDGHQ